MPLDRLLTAEVLSISQFEQAITLLNKLGVENLDNLLVLAAEMDPANIGCGADFQTAPDVDRISVGPPHGSGKNLQRQRRDFIGNRNAERCLRSVKKPDVEVDVNRISLEGKRQPGNFGRVDPAVLNRLSHSACRTRNEQINSRLER